MLFSLFTPCTCFMGRMKHIFSLIITAILLVSFSEPPVEEPTSPSDRVVVGYISSWCDRIPDPQLVTHLNYAFGHITESFDSVTVEQPYRLQRMVLLKQKNPNMSLLLSIGGWASGGFSEMAEDEQLRKKFAQNCRQTVDYYGLDGIDIDWEYPTCGQSGISYSVYDIRNFTLLMRDLREALGDKYLLTFADYADAIYADYEGVLPYVDFINLMSYELGHPPYLHAPLYRSRNTKPLSVSDAVERHLKAGVPPEKLVMGIPFYGDPSREYRGERNFGKINQDGRYVERWDSIAQAPYLVNKAGRMVMSYENVRSIERKCEYLMQKNLRGAMYWEIDHDDESFTLSHKVWDMIHDESKWKTMTDTVVVPTDTITNGNAAMTCDTINVETTILNTDSATTVYDGLIGK